MDNCTIICFSLGFIQSVFVYFLFVVDWNNKEDGTYNTSLRGIVINPQLLMVCPCSSNETLTAVRFQAHQTPIVKCSENIWGLLWFSVLHMPGLGKSDWPFGIKDHALIWHNFYREEKITLTWSLCPSLFAASSFTVIMRLHILPVGHWGYLQDQNLGYLWSI